MRVMVCAVSLVSARRQFRLVACVLLALTCLMAVGIVCTCSADQSLQTIQRVVQSAHSSAALPAAVEVWSVVAMTLVVLLVGSVIVGEPGGRGRASPQVLQRFLF